MSFIILGCIEVYIVINFYISTLTSELFIIYEMDAVSLLASGFISEDILKTEYMSSRYNLKSYLCNMLTYLDQDILQWNIKSDSFY